MKPSHPENLARPALKFFKGLAHSWHAPQALSSVFILQLFEWEFRLVKVNGRSRLATVIRSLPSGQSQRENISMSFSLCPRPPPSCQEVSLCKGHTLPQFIFPVSMVTCSRPVLRSDLGCVRLKVCL